MQDMEYELIHHVAINVTDLERSVRFYREVFGLEEIARPPFDFPGAWFALGGGGQQLHLIVYPGHTLREGKGLEPRDVHFAVRVASFGRAVEYFRSKGYSEDAEDVFRRMIVRPHATAGFPQMYVLDPDRHMIEINAAVLD
ncbi:MAG: VOC family protein [Acidobacteriota bacterium]|nr:VOC family protein [Acidobacteriota bacterium]